MTELPRPPEADPLVWLLARTVWVDHRPDRDGWCVSCKIPAPCELRDVAAAVMERGAAVRWMNV